MGKPVKAKVKAKAKAKPDRKVLIRERVRKHVTSTPHKSTVDGYIHELGDLMEAALSKTTCEEHEELATELIAWAAEIIAAHRYAEDGMAEHATLLFPDHALYRLMRAMHEFQIRSGANNDALVDFLISKMREDSPAAGVQFN